MSDNQEVVTATTENAGEVVDTQAQEPKATSDEPKQKMFTQEELDKIVTERVARERRALEKEFKEKGKNSKVNDNLQKQVADLQNQLAQYEMALAKSKYKIAPDYEDFVDYKVLHRTNKDVSYEQALKEYMEEEGKKFLQAEEEPKVAKQQPRPKNSNTMESANPTNELRKYFGLK